MTEPLPKITASGVHASHDGQIADLPPDRTLSVPPPLGFWGTIRAPLLLFLVGLLVFGAFAWNRVLQPSADNHFVYQADAFLNGQLELTQDPPHGNDWASWIEMELVSGQVVRGVWYDREASKFLTLGGDLLIIEAPERRGVREVRHHFVSFPPGPAVLMMPGVAIWGYDFNDVQFTIVFAALNLALLYLLLRRLSRGGRSGRSARENVVLTLLFGFGTVNLWCSILGQVWFTALVIGVTFTLMYLHLAIDANARSYASAFFAGLFLAGAFATRTPLLLSAMVYPAFLLFPGGRWRRGGWGRALSQLLVFGIAPLIIGVALLYMNHLRFERWTEFGHTYLAGGQITRIRDYGLFNYHFLARNLSAAFTLLPRIQPSSPYVLVSRDGMSLFLTTPVWFYLFKARPRQFVQDVFWHRLMWGVVFAISLLHFFYQNTGWEQFGYRFSMDYGPYLIVLLAIGRYPLTALFYTLAVVGFAVNAFGAVTFKRMGMFYTDWFFDP